jgi:hypothetical protein
MNGNPNHSNLWKKNKKAKADEIAALIPREYLRPKDKPTRLFMDNEYVTGGYMACLPRICTAVYNALLFHCNTETQSAFPGVETLLDHTGESNLNTVSTAIQILEHYGIILVLRKVGRFGRSNLYIFRDVNYWRAVDKSKGRIKIKGWQVGRYQNESQPDINSEEVKAKIDKLTNLNKNYPKELTNQIKSLADQMRINGRKRPLAIPDSSTHSVFRSAYEGEDIPIWRRNQGFVANTAQEQREDIKIDMTEPANTVEMQENEDIKFDITDTEKTVEKRSGDDINIDIIEQAEKGEIMVDNEETIYLDDIRNDDIGPR